MQRFLTIAALALVFAVPAAYAQTGNSNLRAQFGAIIDDLNANSFESFHAAIDDQAFLNRIVGTHVIEEDARQFLAADFKANIQSSLLENFPRARTEAEAQGEILGTIVSFEQANG